MGVRRPRACHGGLARASGRGWSCGFGFGRGGHIVAHENAHPIRRGEARTAGLAHRSFAAKIAEEVVIPECLPTEVAPTHPVPRQEGVDLCQQLFHEPKHMGEISPGQVSRRGIFRECRRGRVLCDISLMATASTIQAIRDRIEREMVAKGFSRRSLSSAAGLSQSAVRDVLDRTENPGIGTLQRIAEALELPVDALTGTQALTPILGNIGAGGEVIFSVDPDEELNDPELEMVPRPPLVVGRIMALRVVGSSMLPKYEDGEVVYVARDHEGLQPDYIGRYCAVRTVDGGTWLKVLANGSQPNRYTLRSLNAPDMENVEVVWASPVLFVMPRQLPVSAPEK